MRSSTRVSSVFARLGFETPRLDTELLLRTRSGSSARPSWRTATHRSGVDAEAAFRASLDRRAAGEPVAYIRGIKEFHGIALAVDKRALIPRPETEHVVDLVLAEVMARLTARAATGAVEPLRVVDVARGAAPSRSRWPWACVPGACPRTRSRSRPSDVSADALDLARENAVGHAVGDRVTFATADLLPPSPPAEPWDVMAANLPYVRSDAMASLPTPTTFEPPGRSMAEPMGWR